jgi:hypothetical protein
MEGNEMHPTNARRWYASLTHIAPAAMQREGTGAALKTAMTGRAGLTVLVLLFLASLAYVAAGGTLAPEPSPIPEPASSMAELAALAAGASNAGRSEKLSGRSAQPADHLPERYAAPSRDGDGNVKTYEHD